MAGVEPARPVRAGLVDGALDHRARTRAEREQTPGGPQRGSPAEGADTHTDGGECRQVEGLRCHADILQGDAQGARGR